MNEALNLLNRQPNTWPRWQRGENLNGTVTNDRHLFIFVPQVVDGEVSLAAIRPACHYVDGADPVDYERKLADDGQSFIPHCYGCLEVELQHGIA